MSLADRCSEIMNEIDATIGAPDKIPDGWVAVPPSGSVKAVHTENTEALHGEPATPKLHPNIFESIDDALSSFVIVREVS